MAINTFKGDSLVVDVTVKEGGVPKDITGGTPDAAIRSPSGAVSAATAAITDAANGVCRLTVATGALNATGDWLAELELAIGAESQTVWQEVLVVADALMVD